MPRLRPAGPDDARAVADLEADLFGPDAWSAAVVASTLADPGRDSVVAIVGEKVVGYLVTRTVGDVVDLERIAVARAHQRTGVASALLAGLPSGRVLLEVAEGNAAARRAYERAGFVEIARRERYYRDGSAALVLERTAPDTNECTTS